MKHPALARVFAVILAILGVLTFFAGIKGFGDTADSNKKALAEADRLEKRRASYIDLSEKLEGRTAYDDVNKALKENREQHDSDAAEHRTEVAEYSAKRGGYNMGADMLWEAKGELAGAKQMLLQMQAAKDAMSASITECNSAAAKCGAAAASAGAAAEKLTAKKQSMPTVPTAPVAPVEPVAPTEPVAPADPDTTKPTEPEKPAEEENEDNKAAWDAYRAEYAGYESAMAEWEKYNDEYPELYAKYESEKTQYAEDYAKYETEKTQYDADKAVYDAALIQYEADMLAYQAWYGEFVAIAGETDFSLWSDAGTAAQSAITNAMNAMPEEMKNQMPGFDPDALPETPSIDFTNLNSPDSIINAFTTAQIGFDYVGGTLGQLSAGFGAAITAMDNQLASEINKMAGGELTIAPGMNTNDIIAMMEAMLSKSEGQIDSGLADIWYGLEELEKDREKLEENKTTLDGEASALTKQEAEAEELKELERRFNSDRVVLTKVSEIKAGVDNGEPLEESAGRYIANYRSETEKNRRNGIFMSALAVAAGIAGAAAIPAAFERTKKRFWLLLPPALCAAAALCAMLMSRDVSDTLYYSTMAAVIFACVHLLIVAPKNKIEV